MSKDAYYFPHDANARNDQKILGMRSVHGIAGYGIYWVIVEIMREQENYKIPISDFMYDAIAMQAQCDRKTIASFIEDCCTKFHENGCSLLKMDDKYLWSESLLRRMKRLDDRRETNRKNAITGWHERKTKDKESNKVKESNNKINNNTIQHIALQPHSESNATALDINLFQYCETKFRKTLNANDSSNLQVATTEYPKEWLIESIDIASSKGKYLNYALAICERWLNEGKKDKLPQTKTLKKVIVDGVEALEYE